MAKSKAGAHRTTSTTSPSSSSTRSSSPPEPFVRAPAVLSEFLGRLDSCKIYIVHVDKQAPSFKRQVFAIPLLTNIVLAVLILWRVYVAAPIYLLILASTLDSSLAGKSGGGSSGGSSPGRTGTAGQRQGTGDIYTILWRTGSFLFDFLLWKLVVPWPRRFFLGGREDEASLAGPTRRRWSEGAWGWKWRVGFPAREVIVRVSRSAWWDPLHSTKHDDDGGGDAAAAAAAARVMSSPEKAATVTASTLASLLDESNPVFATKILPAINDAWMGRRSGYMFIDANWDLDFDAMIAAHAEIADRSSSVGVEDFRKMVLVHAEEFGWLVWEVWELDGNEEQKRMKREGDGGDDAKRIEKEAEDLRRKMNAVRDKLSILGKEDLFYRWIEMMQYETSSPFKSPFETAKIPPPPAPPPSSTTTNTSSSSLKPSSSTLASSSLSVESGSAKPDEKEKSDADGDGTMEEEEEEEEKRRKREKMTGKVKDMFKSQGVDLEDLWREVEVEMEMEREGDKNNRREAGELKVTSSASPQ